MSEPDAEVTVAFNGYGDLPIWDIKETMIPALEDVVRERLRQDLKWGSQRTLTTSKWLEILAEEFGEVAKAVNEGNYDPDDKDNYRTELVQVAAVAVAAVEAYDGQAKLGPVKAEDLRLKAAYEAGRKAGIAETAILCGKCSHPLHGGGGIGPIHCRNVACPDYDDMSKW